MMSRSAAPKHDAIESECVASGGYADVWLVGEALAEWKAVCRRNDENSRKAVARLTAYFPRFADKGPKGFTEEQFKTFGRLKAVGGTEYLILEFKAYQFRLYGVERTYNGKRAFVAVACDPAKKDNKADKKIIRRAANAADNISWRDEK